MSIASLRRSRQEATDALAKSLSDAKKGNDPDANLWKPFLDEEKGVGQAEIRLLPQPEGEPLPYAKVFAHSFKGANGKYYIEKSLTTFSEADPVSEVNKRLWESGGTPDESDAKRRTPNQKIASNQKRKEEYFCNIMVISDPGRPQNEGKVFEYKFGPKIYELIELAQNPKFVGEQKFNPFDFWDGANLKIRVHREGQGKKGFWKYDATSWATPSELFPGDDEAKETIWKQCKSVADRLNRKHFKPYDALAKHLLAVLGPTSGTDGITVPTWVKKEEAEVTPAATSEPVQRSVSVAPQAASVARPMTTAAQVAPTPSKVASDDLAFFESLASQAKAG
jgi:hypothetical protein